MGYFCAGSNNNISLITCENKIFIPSKSEVMYYSGTIRISFVQEWIERSR